MEENEPFTLEYVRQFMVEKGGLCTNHDLVARFKPYLNHSVRKLENRNKLKEFVQLLAVVETRNGEKVLVLKKRYHEQGCFNLFSNQEQLAPSEYQPGGGLVPIPEVFNAVEPQPEPLPPSRPSRSRRKETTEAPINADTTVSAALDNPTHNDNHTAAVPEPRKQYNVDTASTCSSLASTDMDFYSSLFDKKGAASDIDRSSPVACTAGSSAALPPAAADRDIPPVPKTDTCKRSTVHTEPVTFSLEPPPPIPLSSLDTNIPPCLPHMPAQPDTPAAPGAFADEPDAPRTPRQYNGDTINKTPMSAKDRIKQFDQISSDQSPPTTTVPASRRNNKENRNTQHFHNSDSAEYDGGLSMVSLDAKEKEWMLLSASADYHAMNKLLTEQPDLAHRRDFINGYNAMHWAAKHGKPEIIKMLNGYQVDASIRSYCGYTPLHLAAMGSNEECIELLVNLCKVQTSVRDFYGKRPKQYLRKTCSTKIQQMLANNARMTFTVGSTADEAHVFARTQSFSAKIMKTTQGLARKFARDARSTSDAGDRPDSAYSPESYSKFPHSSESRSLSQYTLSDSGQGSVCNQSDSTSGLGSDDSYSMSRSESTPNFPPVDHNGPSATGYTNIP